MDHTQALLEYKSSTQLRMCSTSEILVDVLCPFKGLYKVVLEAYFVYNLLDLGVENSMISDKNGTSIICKDCVRVLWFTMVRTVTLIHW